MATVASFIGADGTNATTNSGRLSISLKPREERKASAEEIIARLRPRLADVEGIAVYLQPVQDLQIDTRVSRTQFQYTLEDADPAELAEWAPRVLEKLRTLPELRDVASDQQAAGLQARLTIDRDTASRLGVLPQAIDDTLYDAFGQRQVSTIFTQLNQYRVILEVKPEFQQDPRRWPRSTSARWSGDQVPLSAFTHFEPARSPLAISHQGQFPSVTLSFNPRPASRSARRSTPSTGPSARSGCRRASTPSSRDRPGLPRVAGQRAAADPRGAHHRLHRARRALRELHPPVTILSTLPSAGVGALLALMLCASSSASSRSSASSCSSAS